LYTEKDTEPKSQLVGGQESQRKKKRENPRKTKGHKKNKKRERKIGTDFARII
jgi:hypothetical protein